MEMINRRKLQCRLCNRRFSRTFLVQQHVAGFHLGLKRWRCTVCHFGAWKRNHVLRHVLESHRQRNAESFLREEPKKVYFSKFMTNSPDPAGEEGEMINGSEDLMAAIPSADVLLLQHNFSDFNGESDCSGSSSSSESGGGGSVASSSQRQLHQNGEDCSSSNDLMQLVGSGDSDEEISFKRSPRPDRSRAAAGTGAKHVVATSRNWEQVLTSPGKTERNDAATSTKETDGSTVSGRDLREPRARTSSSSGGQSRKRAASESPGSSSAAAAAELPRRKIAHI